MATHDWALLARIALGFGLAFVLGFERELRGSPAGDRTFALVGAASAAVTAVAARSSPQAVAGVVTGVGFIGAGVLIQGEGGMIYGVTTAAAIFASAAIGVVVGYGHLVLGAVTMVGVLFILELPHVRVLSFLDARRYHKRFAEDFEPPPENAQERPSPTGLDELA
ncbi:MAG: putative Mg2+ transporter-C (MgtC) family protein [Actinomycetota bacterium]|jgi:putative Mg2+ transporter-C (MgtC) family protein|nr:putative Mg2+ transporter-C (MgtC) family protein [Actinomycetota bacterium]